jgi:hypothetical protein
MVDIRIRFACCASEIEFRPAFLSLFLDHLRTVLAVKGLLRRAFQRALDGSGPFGRPHS